MLFPGHAEAAAGLPTTWAPAEQGGEECFFIQFFKNLSKLILLILFHVAFRQWQPKGSDWRRPSRTRRRSSRWLLPSIRPSRSSSWPTWCILMALGRSLLLGFLLLPLHLHLGLLLQLSLLALGRSLLLQMVLLGMMLLASTTFECMAGIHRALQPTSVFGKMCSEASIQHKIINNKSTPNYFKQWIYIKYLT